MPRLFTIDQLILRGRQRCDQENRDILGAPEWQAELSTIYAEFYGIMVESGARYFESTDAISTTSGTPDYAVPADHMTTIGVDFIQPGGQRYELKEMLAQERNVHSGSSASQSTSFALIGGNVRLYPPPATGQTYEHVYVSQPADISSLAGSSTVDVITPDGESFFIWSLALVGGIKEESDQIITYAKQMEAARRRVEDWAQSRSMHTAKRRHVDAGYSRFDDADWMY